MTVSSVWAVVPVKPFQLAKTRLAPVLSEAERARLARLMLEDVLTALANSRPLFEGVIVQTADSRIEEVVRPFGAEVLGEPEPAGLNAAVAAASERLSRVPDAGMVVFPSDLPHLSQRAIRRVVACLAASRSVALVKATGDGGTNVLGCRPAGIIPPRFGPCSFDAHFRAARAAGIAPEVLDLAQLGHDLDRPGDLLTFLRARTPTRTHAYLTTLGIEERLPCLTSS